MKHYHTFLHSTCALALGALLAVNLSGCTADELAPEPGTAPSELGDITLLATLGEGIDTRTGHEEADPADPTQGIKVTWAPGDDIKIVNRDNSSTTIFTFAGMTADGKGIFKGKTELENGMNVIIYPARVVTDKSYKLHLDMTGQTQWGNGSMAHLGAYDVMKQSVNVSDWSSFSLSFPASSHLNALMTFDLTGIPADLGRPQSITLGCTSTTPVFNNNTEWYSGITYVPTFELKLTGFATPADGTTVDIKAYLMMAKTTIPAGESLIITVRGTMSSYTFTSAAMAADKVYKSANRYTATVGAGEWKKVYSDFTYTGTEAEEAFTGSGTSAADPFVIGTPGQLRRLIEGAKTGDNFSKGKFFRLAANINIEMAAGTNWTPIGTTEDTAFCGTFDGDGHTISGTMAGSDDNIGFFGYLNGATIRNLTIDAAVSGGENVGGIAGICSLSGSSYIINCVNKGTVTATRSYVGGIMGDASTTDIIGCVNQGNILGHTCCGGIAGYISEHTITACYNTGKIVSTAGYTKQIGAIAGQAVSQSIISYCQYVPDAANTELQVFGVGSTSSGAHISNTKYADLAALNGTGVTTLNHGIGAWNITNTIDATKQCPFHFVPGTATTGPTLEAGAPTN